MEDNKVLRTEYVNSFYVIIADRDGVRKYVSREFPRTFPYTIKLDKAKRFDTKEQAENFVSSYYYVIENPEVRKVCRRLELV